MAKDVNPYQDIYEDAIALEGVEIKESLLPVGVAGALRAVQDVGYATLIVYDADARLFRFSAVRVE